jgi:hypothetical protein
MKKNQGLKILGDCPFKATTENMLRRIQELGGLYC